MRLERRIPGIFALALIIACGLPTTAHTQTLGQLAVLRGNPPVVDLRSPATGNTTQTWPDGDTAARGLALRYDDNGVLESVFVAHTGQPLNSIPPSVANPASVTRIVAATGMPDGPGPAYPGATLYDLAVDRDGSVLLAMRTALGQGCVSRLSADMATTTNVHCLPPGQMPWALALNQDGRILIGWNSAIDEMSANGSNGVILLNPETGVTESLNEVTGSALLSDIAVAPGGLIYLAEYRADEWSGTGASISWLDPAATPITRTVLLPGQGTILVRPAQMAIVGTSTAHTIYVADPWGMCGGGGGGMEPPGLGQPCPANGGLVTVASSGGAVSRVPIGWDFGPYGIGFVGSAVTASPVDATTGTAPVTLTFDGVSSTGSTSLVTSTVGPTPPSGFQLGDPATYYEITTEVGFTGGITVCVNYPDGSYVDETQLKLNHWNGSAWEELPNQTLDTAANVVCGRTMSLSPFAIFEPAVPDDTEGPALSVTVSQATLWPPNGKFVPITLSGSAFDPSGIASLTYRLADEYGTFSTPPQTLTLPKTLFLEALRAGNDMDGRLYTITVTATDTFGNVSQQALQVRVLHDQRQ